MINGQRLKVELFNSAIRVLAVLIIFMSLYIVVGRQLVSQVGEYRVQVEDELSRVLGLSVEIGNLVGRWQGLGPTLSIEQVRIGEEFEIGAIELSPSLLSSLIRGHLVASNIQISDLRLLVTRISDDSGWSLSDWVVKPADKGPDPSAGLEVKTVFDLLQPLLIQDNITLSNLAVILAVDDTDPLIVQVERAWFESLFDTKKLTLDGWIFSGQQSANFGLIAELDQWLDQPAGQIYMKQEYFDWSPWTHYLPAHIGIKQLSTDLEAWLTLENGVVTEVRSRLDVPEIKLIQDARQVSVQDIHTELTASLSGGDTRLWLNDLTFAYLGKQWRPSLHQLFMGQGNIEMLSDRVDVGLLSALGGVITNNPVLEGLAPRGQLINSRILWTANAPPGEQLLIQGRFADAEVTHWRGIPGLTGLDGYVDMTLAGGYLHIEPSDTWLDLPRVFEAPVYISRTSGGLQWRWSKDSGLYLASNKLKTDISGVENISLAFSVLAPQQSDWPVREPRFEFHLEFDRSNQDRLSTFLPLSMNLASRAWILDRVNRADVRRGNLTLSLPTQNTRLPNSSPLASTVLLDLEIEQGALSVMPEWPDITDVSATLSLKNNHLSIAVDQAQHQGLQLKNGQLDLVLKPDAAVQVDINAKGSSADTLAYLTSTPVRNAVGDAFDQWVVAEGQVEARVRLAIPINGGVPSVKVGAQISQTDLILPEYELALFDLDGGLQWQDGQGISSQNLTAQFFGHPTQLSISSAGDQMEQVAVEASGAANLKDLGYWLDDALLRSLDQISAYQATLRVQEEGVDIHVRSNLEQVSIPYPYPFNKAAGQLWPLDIRVQMDPQRNTNLVAHLNQQFTAVFSLKEGQVDRGVLSSSPTVALPSEPGIFIDLAVDTVDGDAWQLQIEDWIALYADYTPVSSNQSPSLDTLIQEVTLNASQFVFFDETWNRVEILGSRSGDGWIASYKANEIQGTFGWGHDKQAVMVVDIDFVSLTRDKDSSDSSDVHQDPLRDYDPRVIPNALVQIRRLSLDGRDLGEWSARLESLEDGVKISKVRGAVTGVAIAGDLYWRRQGRGSKTALTAQAQIGDLGRVLAAWNQVSDVRTQSGQIQADLNWPGSPLGLVARALQGDINLSFTNGTIMNVGQDFDSLKVLSILNPAMLMRRLAFDFSDVVGQGIQFDRIEGRVSFGQGQMQLSKPVVLTGSSSTVQIGGGYDFDKDNMAFEMVFTLPLTNAIPIAALIAGLSPQVALAMFVTERILNNELSKFTSVKYVITGPADKPEFKLLRAFDNALTAPKKP